MRYVVAGLSVLALAGCGPRQDASDATFDNIRGDTMDVAAADTEPRAAIAAPGISVTAAPGVAFDYRYAFRLPSAAIAPTQEAHAAACEKLGVARCRVTGMRYKLTGADSVEAMLQFKLAPEVARAFGRDGIRAVEAAKGTLVDAEISGTDAGAALKRIAADRDSLDEQVRRIDAELVRPGRPAGERRTLQEQRAELQRRIEAAGAEGADQREALANTPMAFRYQSGPAIRGFDASAPLTSAVDTAIGSIQVTLAVLLGAIALLGPPALALLLLWLLWRRIGGTVRRLFSRRRLPDNG